MDETLYKGKGTPQPGAAVHRTNLEKSLKPWENPRDYLAGDDLADAVNSAIYLGQPLLLTGEPGSGKTQLAYSIAWEFDFPLHVFHTRMNSAGLDLFYRYDALLHFHDASAKSGDLDFHKYIQYNALGEAILFTRPPEEWGDRVEKTASWTPTRSVVLIDEIDKAPRDFPNDILFETDQLAFEVKEKGWQFQVDRSRLPIVIFTSN